MAEINTQKLKIKNYIFILYGRANEGKTTTLLKLFELLTGEKNEGDISRNINFEGNKIGFVTSSDPYGDNLDLFKIELENKISENCRYIFCTSRTKGKSVEIIDNLPEKYDKVWLSTIWVPTLNINYFNNCQAEFLKKILLEIIDNQNI